RSPIAPAGAAAWTRCGWCSGTSRRSSRPRNSRPGPPGPTALSPVSVYLVRRLLATIPVMGVVAVFVFALLHLTPGDPATIVAGDFATAEDIRRIHVQLGLDRPLHVQFVAWLGRILSGDLGTSIFSRRPVAELIGQRLE